MRAWLTIPPSRVRWLVLVWALGFMALFSWLSIARYRYLTADSLNYVEVARNIAAGRGLVQHAVGFNNPKIEPNVKIPAPFTQQGPVYPLAIAALARLAIPPTTAALVISTLGFGASVLLLAWIAARLYDRATAGLVALLAVAYGPLWMSARFAWSETLGVALVLGALLATMFALSDRRPLFFAGLSGLLCGTAFATRFAFVPLIVATAGALAIWSPQRARALICHVSAAAVVAAPVVWRNIAATGSFAPPKMPSDKNVFANLVDVYEAMFGRVIPGPPRIYAPIMLSLVALLAAAAWYRRKNAPRPEPALSYHFLPLAWVLGYLVFLVYTRSQRFFDPIGWRLILPAGVVALIWLGRAFVVAVGGRPDVLRAATVVLAIYASAREVRAIYFKPINMAVPPALAETERLRWVARNASTRDLIIGNQTYDIPYYLPRRPVINYSPYPYSVQPGYADILTLSHHRCKEYERLLLVLHVPAKKEHAAFRNQYGEFFSDLAGHGFGRYPRLIPMVFLKDARVFRIQCP
jgi:hypothetical protein